MTNKKYYQTIFTIVVLSEDSVSENMSLENIHYEVTQGSCVLKRFTSKEKILNGKQIARALYDAGSDPGFFQLDEKGNKINE